MNFEDNDVIDEVHLHLNEICITSALTVERLIGYAYDSKDRYYVFKDLDGGTTYYTGAGSFTILKDITPDYNNIERCFALNGNIPVLELELIHLEDEEEEQEYHDADEEDEDVEDDDLSSQFIEEFLKEEE